MKTADLIRHGNDLYTVACCHDDVIHTCGYPERTLRVDQCELVHEASLDDRLDLLRKMAAAGGNGHRPACARRQLGEIACS